LYRYAVGAAFDAKGKAGDVSPPSAAGDALAVGTGLASGFYASAQTAYFPKEAKVSPVVVQAGGALVMLACTLLTVAVTHALGSIGGGGGGAHAHTNYTNATGVVGGEGEYPYGGWVIPWSTPERTGVFDWPFSRDLFPGVVGPLYKLNPVGPLRLKVPGDPTLDPPYKVKNWFHKIRFQNGSTCTAYGVVLIGSTTIVGHVFLTSAFQNLPIILGGGCVQVLNSVGPSARKCLVSSTLKPMK
jgi:hypothetical protein